MRRLTAFFLGLLLANLIWVGSGYACVMPGMGHSMGSTTTADATGRAMAEMNMAGTTATTDKPPQDQTPPCRFPWVPDGCQSMTPCAPHAIIAHAFVLAMPNATPVRVAELAVLTPPSALRAPDLPPPRA
jgi:hypothetical protein